MRLKSVALNNKQCVAVEPRGIRRLLCKQVEICVSAPLRHNLRSLAKSHRHPVEYRYHAPVCLCRPSADIDHRDISAVDVLSAFIGKFPYLPPTRRKGREAIVIDFSGTGRHPASLSQSLDLVFVEHTRSRMHESLDVIARIFGSHEPVFGIFRSLRLIPVYSLECRPLLPKPPQICPRLTAV